MRGKEEGGEEYGKTESGKRRREDGVKEEAITGRKEVRISAGDGKRGRRE